jgi:hypothetical protein
LDEIKRTLWQSVTLAAVRWDADQRKELEHLSPFDVQSSTGSRLTE